MELTNLMMRYRGTEAAGTDAWDEAVRLLMVMLAPVAPHIAEELWSRRLEAAGGEWSSIHVESWPQFDESLVAAEMIELPVQVNGKLRDKVTITPGLPEDEIEALVMAQPKVQANLEGKQVVKVIHVGGRLVNIVVR
jgi:leucyl-tRNA synthetase